MWCNCQYDFDDLNNILCLKGEIQMQLITKSGDLGPKWFHVALRSMASWVSTINRDRTIYFISDFKGRGRISIFPRGDCEMSKLF